MQRHGRQRNAALQAQPRLVAIVVLAAVRERVPAVALFRQRQGADQGTGGSAWGVSGRRSRPRALLPQPPVPARALLSGRRPCRQSESPQPASAPKCVAAAAPCESYGPARARAQRGAGCGLGRRRSACGRRRVAAAAGRWSTRQAACGVPDAVASRQAQQEGHQQLRHAPPPPCTRAHNWPSATQASPPDGGVGAGGVVGVPAAHDGLPDPALAHALRQDEHPGERAGAAAGRGGRRGE